MKLEKYFKNKPGRLFNGEDVNAVFWPIFTGVAFADFLAAACLYRDWTIRDIFSRKNYLLS